MTLMQRQMMMPTMHLDILLEVVVVTMHLQFGQLAFEGPRPSLAGPT